jgi:hypothetical protein
MSLMGQGHFKARCYWWPSSGHERQWAKCLWAASAWTVNLVGTSGLPQLSAGSEERPSFLLSHSLAARTGKLCHQCWTQNHFNTDFFQFISGVTFWLILKSTQCKTYRSDRHKNKIHHLYVWTKICVNFHFYYEVFKSAYCSKQCTSFYLDSMLIMFYFFTLYILLSHLS